jgi:hypothetical protein
MTDKPRTTGNDAIEGVDPGGTRPTKPGNPDKHGGARPETVREEQTVKTGDQNDFLDRDKR